MKNLLRWLQLLLLAVSLSVAQAQEFGFGDTGDAENGEASATVSGDDGFGFSEEEPAAGGISGASVGGRLDFSVSQFFNNLDDFTKSDTVGAAGARLDFSASGAGVDGFLRLRLSQSILANAPSRILDEARLRLYLGDLNLEGGLLKVTWGKADSLRVLDVLNPLDLSDLTVSDPLEQKIAVPMFRTIWYPGTALAFDAVFLPFFTPNRIAFDGRWVSSEVVALKDKGRSMLFYGPDSTANGGKGSGLYANAVSDLFSSAYASSYAVEYQKAYTEASQAAYTAAYAAAITPYMPSPTPAQQAAAQAAAQAAIQTPAQQLSLHTAADAKATAAALTAANTTVTAQDAVVKSRVNAEIDKLLPNLPAYPDTASLEYSQAGLRITGSLGPVDLGAQYFFGFLPLPVISIASVSVETLAANGYRVPVAYNRYHQVGADFAAVLLGFNTRGEFALNLTYDAEGKDPAVYNQTAAGALGFDRELFAGISLNLQGKVMVRLAYDNITDPADIEKGRDRTESQLLARLSQSLAKDAVVWELAGIYGVEDTDFVVVPKLTFKIGDAALDLSGRIFGGPKDGAMGQFRDRSYAQLQVSYEF